MLLTLYRRNEEELGGGGGWQNRSFPEVDGDSSTHGIAEIEHLHPARLHLYIV